MKIRKAVPEDAPALLEIYRPYVEKTAITFECDTPSPEEFRERICRISSRFPYYVAEDNDVILGYCYAASFHPREAYSWCAETTIYLREDFRQKGLGRLLYDALEKELREMGFSNLYACVAVPEEEDEHLTFNSFDFHRHMGYTPLGTFHQCGYKFHRWYHMVWLEKLIGPHKEDQAPVCFYN